MSQVTDENVSEWSRDDCVIYLEEYFDKLTDGFALLKVPERASIEKNLETCCKRLLKSVPVKCLDSEAFFKILPKIESIVSTIADEISNVFGKQSVNFDDVENYIKDLHALIVCVEMCFDAEAFRVMEIEVEHMFTLPTTALNISYNVFRLFDKCMKLNEFSNVSKSFSNVFSQSTTLTNKFMSFWAKVNIVIGLESHTKLLLTVCSKVTKICHIFETISGKSPVTLWKFIINILAKYCESIKDRVDVAEIIRLLCSLTETRLKNLHSVCSNAEEITSKEESDQLLKSIQQCNFNLKIIIKLTEKYKFFLGNCFKDLLNLVLCLYQNTCPSLKAANLPKDIKADFERNVNVVVEPLVLQLLDEPEYIRIIANTSYTDDNVYSPYSWCLFYVFILENIDKIPANLQSCVLPVVFNYKGDSKRQSQNLLDKFFDTFSLCEVEIGLPVMLSGVMCDGKQFQLVSFYEFCCTRFCSFIVGISAKHYPLLENVLLTNVLNDNIWKSILASDLWTFLGRIESPDLCYEHCCYLAELTSRNCKAKRLNLTLRRLFNILSDDHKMMMYRKYHPSIKTEVWVSVGFQALASLVSFRDDLELLNNQLIGRIKLSLESNSDSGEMLINMCNVIYLLSELARVNPNCRQAHVELNCRLWQCIPTNIGLPNDPIDRFCYHLIEWSSQLLSVLPNDLLLEILQKLFKLQTNSNSALIGCGILRFLTIFSSKFVPASSEQSLILKQIAQLLSNCLEEKNPVLLHIGLETFVNVSQSTPHETIISGSLYQRPHLQQMVTNFLNKKPFKSSMNLNSNKQTLLQNEIERLKHQPNDTIVEPMEVEPKELPVEVERILQQLDTTINRLNELNISENVDQTLLRTKIQQLTQKLVEIHK
ncbi:hypothetical protein CHUAL_008148 [Chamberlinius hualienensis]